MLCYIKKAILEHWYVVCFNIFFNFLASFWQEKVGKWGENLAKKLFLDDGICCTIGL